MGMSVRIRIMPIPSLKATSTTHKSVLALSIHVEEMDKDIQSVAQSVSKIAEQINQLSSSTQILSNNDATLGMRLAEAEKRLTSYEERRFDLNMVNKEEHTKLHEQILTLQNTLQMQIGATTNQQQTQFSLTSEKVVDRLMSVGLVVLGIILTYVFTHH